MLNCWDIFDRLHQSIILQLDYLFYSILFIFISKPFSQTHIHHTNNQHLEIQIDKLFLILNRLLANGQNDYQEKEKEKQDSDIGKRHHA